MSAQTWPFRKNRLNCNRLQICWIHSTTTYNSLWFLRRRTVGGTDYDATAADRKKIQSAWNFHLFGRPVGNHNCITLVKRFTIRIRDYANHSLFYTPRQLTYDIIDVSTLCAFDCMYHCTGVLYCVLMRMCRIVRRWLYKWRGLNTKSNFPVYNCNDIVKPGTYEIKSYKGKPWPHRIGCAPTV